MKKTYLQNELRIVSFILLTDLIVSASVYGWRGFVGMAVGISATWLHVWLLWRIITILGDSSREQPIVRQGTGIVVIGFLIQLPAFVLLGIGIPKLGPGALPCFVAGLGMVYFGVVGWAISRT